jgi:dTDP-4-dehydrorhamnose reductase
MDIADRPSVEAALDQIQPWAVINTAGYVRVDDAERDRDLCRRENVDGPRILAEACATRGCGLVTFSSDLVFDGRKRAPYEETDSTSPINVYGRTKADAEARVLEALDRALVIRTSAFFGPWDEHNFVTIALRRLAAGEAMQALCDVEVSPTYVPDLVHATLDLLIDGESGIWHLANAGSITWAGLVSAAAALAGVSTEGMEEQTLDRSRMGYAAARPTYSVLKSGRGAVMAPLGDALGRYLADRAHYLSERELERASIVPACAQADGSRRG